MKKKSNNIFIPFLISIFILATNGNNTVIASTLDSDSSVFINKVSKAYTKKFCNSIAFGLSKESAMNFSIAENNKVYKKKKEMDFVNKELLAEEIAVSVVENCGYPIDLKGEEGINEFKNYYLSKDKELIE